MKKTDYQVDCLLLAGGEESDLTQLENVKNKTLISICGLIMIRHILDVIISIRAIDRIVVVADTEEFSFLKNYYNYKDIEIVPEKGNLIDNLLAGIYFLKSRKHILVCSSDIPFITIKAINDFLYNSQDEYRHDIYYPVIPKEKIQFSFPGAKKTFIKTKEGVFTGSNVFLINPKKAEKMAQPLRGIIQIRKSPLKIAYFLGIDILLRLISGRVSFGYIEEFILKKFGVSGKIVLSDYPGLGFDIDKKHDLVLARKILGELKLKEE